MEGRRERGREGRREGRKGGKEGGKEGGREEGINAYWLCCSQELAAASPNW